MPRAVSEGLAAHTERPQKGSLLLGALPAFVDDPAPCDCIAHLSETAIQKPNKGPRGIPNTPVERRAEPPIEYVKPDAVEILDERLDLLLNRPAPVASWLGTHAICNEGRHESVARGLQRRIKLLSSRFRISRVVLGRPH